jgi:hypothetical protein
MLEGELAREAEERRVGLPGGAGGGRSLWGQRVGAAARRLLRRGRRQTEARNEWSSESETEEEQEADSDGDERDESGGNGRSGAGEGAGERRGRASSGASEDSESGELSV